MGQERTRLHRFQEKHPWCCYCGGSVPTASIDHVPSKQMFIGKRRPKGLEVPACNACNSATKNIEQEAAYLGRVFPDARTPEEKKDIASLTKAITNNNHSLLLEMIPSQEQLDEFEVEKNNNPNIPSTAHALNVKGPLINRAIEAFATKLCLALHYCTTNQVVPVEGGIVIRWHTNYMAMTTGLPEEILQIMGGPKTLRQGKWNAEDQFFYQYTIADTKKMAVYHAAFYMSFTVMGFVHHSATELPGLGEARIYQPRVPGSSYDLKQPFPFFQTQEIDPLQ